MKTHLKLLSLKFLYCLVLRILEFRWSSFSSGSGGCIGVIGMGFSLPLLGNTQNFLMELSSRFIYSHNLYFEVSEMYAMISLYLYLSCMIRWVNLVPRQWFQYSYVCSSMMSVHPEGGDSVRDTSVRPGLTEPRTWPKSYMIRGGTWPTSYASCNY
jgi:hypothetical protein